MPDPSDGFFQKQEAELARYTEKRAREFLRVLENTRARLQAEITDLETFDQRRTLSLIQQIEEMIGDTERQLKQLGTADRPLAEMVQRHTEATVEAITSSRVALTFDRINPDVIRQFALNELDKVTGLTKLEMKSIKNILLNRVGVKGENPTKVARAIVGKGSPFHRRFGHVETILRTETSTIYNAQSVQAIKASNEDYDLGLNKRIVETLDNRRNHPISQVLNGQVAPVMMPDGDVGLFKAKVSDVNARAAALGKSSSGIFWIQSGGYYIGEKLPAHYRDRGIVTATERHVNVPQ